MGFLKLRVEAAVVEKYGKQPNCPDYSSGSLEQWIGNALAYAKHDTKTTIGSG